MRKKMSVYEYLELSKKDIIYVVIACVVVSLGMLGIKVTVSWFDFEIPEELSNITKWLSPIPFLLSIVCFIPILPRKKVRIELVCYDGVIVFDRDKYDTNGTFRAEATFRLRVSGGNVKLCRFSMECYDDRRLNAWTTGCRLYKVGEDGKYKRVATENGHLVSPIAFTDGETPMLYTIADYRPSSPDLYPADWDFGYLELAGSVSISISGETTEKQFSFFYRYKGGRALELADAPQFPRLSDDELKRLVAEGLISSEEQEILLAVTPRKRYLIFSNRLENPEERTSVQVVSLIQSVRERMEDAD